MRDEKIRLNLINININLMSETITGIDLARGKISNDTMYLK